MTSALYHAPTPHAPVQASVLLPGSKSLTNRALILAALADGPSTIQGALRSRDTLLMAQALTSLGATVDTSGHDWVVEPGWADGSREVDCGLAGTVMRFVPALAALRRGDTHFDGDPHARTRPMGAILGALAELGVDVDGAPATLPFVVRGQGVLPGGSVTIDASASSQFVSALLLAAPRSRDGIRLTHDGERLPSLPHIEMTMAALAHHGVEVEFAGSTWWVPPQPVRARDSRIEPDLSNAAPFIAIAAVTGGEVLIRHWPKHTTQAGAQLAEILPQFGVEVSLDDEGARFRGPGWRNLTGVDLDLGDVGELTPAVAALCALAQTPSRLSGIAHIRGHETDRLAALAREINGLGGRVTERPDGLDFAPSPLGGGIFHTYADHRMAHAGVILGLATPGVLVENLATTSKTFTDFDQAWEGAVGLSTPGSTTETP